jgi:hypothetical protein
MLSILGRSSHSNVIYSYSQIQMHWKPNKREKDEKHKTHTKKETINICMPDFMACVIALLNVGALALEYLVTYPS